MSKTPTVSSNPQAKRKQIIASAVNDVERFRINAKISYSEFTLPERNQLNTLEAGNLCSNDVLLAWQEELLPKQTTLNDKQHETKFNEIMIDNLLLNKDEAQSKIDEIIEKRKSEILIDFIYKLYSSKINKNSDLYSKQRVQAKHLSLIHI